MATSGLQISMALYSKPPDFVGSTNNNNGVMDNDMCGAIQDLKLHGHVELVSDMAIISIIGGQKRQTMSLAGNIFSTLGKNNISIAMICQGWFCIYLSWGAWVANNLQEPLNQACRVSFGGMMLIEHSAFCMTVCSDEVLMRLIPNCLPDMSASRLDINNISSSRKKS